MSSRTVAAAVCVVGLWPYVVIARTSYFGLGVLVNGLLWHGAKMSDHPLAALAMWWDILWNVVFGVTVNLTTEWQPQTLWLTIFSSTVFLINSHLWRQTRPVLCAAVHVVLTQWPLGYSLHRWAEQAASGARA